MSETTPRYQVEIIAPADDDLFVMGVIAAVRGLLPAGTTFGMAHHVHHSDNALRVTRVVPNIEGNDHG